MAKATHPQSSSSIAKTISCAELSEPKTATHSTSQHSHATNTCQTATAESNMTQLAIEQCLSKHSLSKHSLSGDYLFVDTGLFPTLNPVRTLGVMEKERWILLKQMPSNNPDLPKLSSEKHLDTIQQVIVSHYASHIRGLPLWGDIQRYCYYRVSKDGHLDKVWFDTKGQVIQVK